MSKSLCMTCLTFALVALSGFCGTTQGQDNLGEALRVGKWERLIGTWIDADSQGATVKTTYDWKFENHLIEVSTEMAGSSSTGLIGRNASTGDLYHFGADDNGGSSIGTWKFSEDEATLELGFTSGDGQEGAVKLLYKFEGDDTVLLTIEADQPIEIKMIRSKKATKK